MATVTVLMISMQHLQRVVVLCCSWLCGGLLEKAASGPLLPLLVRQAEDEEVPLPPTLFLPLLPHQVQHEHGVPNTLLGPRHHLHFPVLHNHLHIT